MKALSIKQPWLHAILREGKDRDFEQLSQQEAVVEHLTIPAFREALASAIR